MKKKKLPYGLADFVRVKTEDYYYIDKTKFIPIIEEDKNFLYFLRPRRFGKSLFMNMMCAYYDIYYKDRFDEIFKDTWILNNPTKLKSSFYILKFDFSAVDITRYEESFLNHLKKSIDKFIVKYNLSINLNLTNPIDNLEKLFNYCNENNLPIYLFIDEYDNFANKLLVSSINDYEGLVTNKNASYKEFFTMLKAGTSSNESSLKKMFITGVTPVALYDVSSGSNIGANISLEKKYNDMVGITSEELNNLIEYYNFNDKKEQIISRCNYWYNNYRFNKDIEHTIYNTDMIFYYFDYMIENNTEPEYFIDDNVRTDYTKLKFLVYTNKRLNGNFNMIKNIVAGESITSTAIKTNFSAFELSNEDNFKSFMFSLGFMNISKYRIGVKYKSPNQTMKKLLSEFVDYGYRNLDNYKINVEEFNNQLLDLAYEKDLSCFSYLANIIKNTSSLRDYISGENFIKAYFLAYLNLNTFYEVYSEREFNQGYVDILLKPALKEVPYGAMIELKYLKKEDSDNILKEKIEDAKNQLIKYDKGNRYIKIIIVFRAYEMIYCKILDI